MLESTHGPLRWEGGDWQARFQPDEHYFRRHVTLYADERHVTYADERHVTYADERHVTYADERHVKYADERHVNSYGDQCWR